MEESLNSSLFIGLQILVREYSHALMITFHSHASKMLNLFFASILLHLPTLASILWHFHNEGCQEVFVGL